MELAHAAGALAWVDAVHYAAHRPIDVRDLGFDVCSVPRTSSAGRISGSFYGRRELLETWRPYKVRPAPDDPVGGRFETGTLPHEALAGFVAAVAYVESVGRRESPPTSASSGTGAGHRTSSASTVRRRWTGGWRRLPSRSRA